VGAIKLEPWDWDLLAAAPAALGRYLFNFAFPVRLAASYHPGTGAGIAATALLPLWFWVFLRVGARDWRARAWLVLAAVALAPVIVLPTRVFVSDTYALLPAVGFAGVAARLLVGRPGILGRRWAPALVVIGFVLLSGLSVVQARAWRSDDALWERSALVEPSPRNLLARAGLLLERGDFAGSEILARAALAWDPTDDEAVTLVSRALYERGTPLDESGWRDLEIWSETHAWVTFYRLALLVRAGRASEAADSVEQVIGFRAAYGEQWPKVAADLEEICRLGGRGPCVPR
jgi:hypothetical protein